MKLFRILILVLMTVLLPIRGAVAATMLCSESAVQSKIGMVAEHGHHVPQANHHPQASDGEADNAASDHLLPSLGAAGDDSSHGGHANTCDSCASGCCMASVVGTVPTVAQPAVTLSVAFPVLKSPIAAFHSGGQDRPPRTL